MTQAQTTMSADLLRAHFAKSLKLCDKSILSLRHRQFFADRVDGFANEFKYSLLGYNTLPRSFLVSVLTSSDGSSAISQGTSSGDSNATSMQNVPTKMSSSASATPLPTEAISVSTVPVQIVHKHFKTTVFEAEYGGSSSHCDHSASTATTIPRNAITVLFRPLYIDKSREILERYRGQNHMDILPLVRLYCLNLSFNPDNYRHDSSITKCFNNLEMKFDSVVYTPPPKFQSQIIAMPVNVFLNWIDGHVSFDEENSIFTPCNMDISWTAIPMQKITKNRSIPYILSFLTSEFWNGCVTMKYVTGKKPNGLVDSIYTMPVANSVHIPGPKNFILLIENYHVDSIRISDLIIPVWIYKVPNVPIPDCFTTFTSYLTNCDIVLKDLAMAEQELLNYSVRGSAEIARSIAASLYAAWRPGCYLNPEIDSSHLRGHISIFKNDENDQDCKGWHDIPGTQYKTFNAAHESPSMIKTYMEAFNFSALNGLLLPFTGHAEINQSAPYTWSTSNPTAAQPQYYVPIASSISRLLAHLENYTYTWRDQNECISASLHMKSYVLSLSTTLMLVENDIKTSFWSGFSKIAAMTPKDFEMGELKRNIFSGLINHSLVWNDVYDESCKFNPRHAISVRYDLDPLRSFHWYSCSPVPSAILIQWAKNIAVPQPKSLPYPKNFCYKNERYLVGIPIKQHDFLQKVILYTTVDIRECLPSVYLLCGCFVDGAQIIYYWMEQEAYQSTVMLSGITHWPKSSKYFMSKSLTVSEYPIALNYAPAHIIYISRYANINSFKVHGLEWLYRGPKASVLPAEDADSD